MLEVVLTMVGMVMIIRKMVRITMSMAAIGRTVSYTQPRYLCLDPCNR